MLRPGDPVVDQMLGPARVIRETQRGFLIQLDGAAGLKVDRPLDALRLPDGTAVEGQSPGPGVRSVSETEAHADDFGFRARKAVDALRFGVVPETHLAELTLRHDELVEWAEQHLARPGSPPMASAVYGPFGAGKSHAMAAIRDFARGRGYLVMATEVNGGEISLAQPRELLSSLLLHLSDENALEGSAPLTELVNLAEKKGSREPAGSRSPSLNRVIRTVARLRQTAGFDDLEPLVERLLGSDPALNKTDFKRQVAETLDYRDYYALPYSPEYNPTTLVVYSPVERRPFDFAEALIGYACVAKQAGYQGLVVTIDELEVESAMYTSARWTKLLGFVQAMHNELGEREGLVGGLSLFLAAVGEDDRVEDEVVEVMVRTTGGGSYPLAPWDDYDLLLLSERIHALYMAAYGEGTEYEQGEAQQTLRHLDAMDLTHSGRIRAFIRHYVSGLDMRFGPPVQ